ncbi:MAG: ABC transporter [Cytophagaceae bacterium]|nr:ABC transporter [Gemmatimonadaceae bacterium]
MRHPNLATASTVVLLGFFTACTDGPASPGSPPGVLASFDLGTAQACGNTTTVNLEPVAGGAPIGTVDAWNDANDLHVVFTAALGGEWRLRETFVQAGTSVGAIPLLVSGTPQLAAFMHKKAHNPTVGSYEVVLPLASVGGTPGTDLVIAAIAKAARGLTAAFAHGNGSQINPPALHEYFVHPVQRCGTPPPPPPGTDIVVFNDINVLDQTAMANPNNQLMVKNLVNYTNAGPRGSGKTVWFDCGHSSISTYTCTGTGGYWGTLHSVVQGEGFTAADVFTPTGGLTSIPADVKVLFLVNPCSAYDLAEINTLKVFASEGGRVVFVGEHAGYYGSCIPIENQFLLDLGAVMTNQGLAVDCGHVTQPGTSLRPHQITTGMTNVTMGCSSVVVLGPNDYPLYYDQTNTQVLSAVATIDVNTTVVRRTAVSLPPLVLPAGLKATPTGR